MTTRNSEGNVPDCSTAGKGFARTENSNIASESCGLPARGFGNTDFGKNEVSKENNITQIDSSVMDCSTAGMGFARTDRTKIAPENCAFPSRGFATTDTGKKTSLSTVEEEDIVDLPITNDI